jgi:hypothetical protein
MKLQLIIEKAGKNYLSGRIEDKGNFMPNTIAADTKTVIRNIKELIVDYQENGGNKDPFWKKVRVDELEFEFYYDVQAFFSEHPYLNISSVAEMAGLNPGLVRQYASGVKYPSKEQAAKIEKTVKRLARDLQEVSLV